MDCSAGAGVPTLKSLSLTMLCVVVALCHCWAYVLPYSSSASHCGISLSSKILRDVVAPNIQSLALVALHAHGSETHAPRHKTRHIVRNRWRAGLTNSSKCQRACSGSIEELHSFRSPIMARIFFHWHGALTWKLLTESNLGSDVRGARRQAPRKRRSLAVTPQMCR